MNAKLPHARNNNLPAISGELADVLADLVIGQPAAIAHIVPFIEIHEAGLSAEGRPAVVSEVEGAAFRTGEHRFVLDPRDPLGPGFSLR